MDPVVYLPHAARKCEECASVRSHCAVLTADSPKSVQRRRRSSRSRRGTVGSGRYTLPGAVPYTRFLWSPAWPAAAVLSRHVSCAETRAHGLHHVRTPHRCAERHRHRGTAMLPAWGARIACRGTHRSTSTHCAGHATRRCAKTCCTLLATTHCQSTACARRTKAAHMQGSCMRIAERWDALLYKQEPVRAAPSMCRRVAHSDVKAACM